MQASDRERQEELGWEEVVVGNHRLLQRLRTFRNFGGVGALLRALKHRRQHELDRRDFSLKFGMILQDNKNELPYLPMAISELSLLWVTTDV